MKPSKSRSVASQVARQTERKKVAAALKKASFEAGRRLRQAGLKLPTQDWNGGPIRNPLIPTPTPDLRQLREDERIDAALKEASREAKRQLKLRGLTLPTAGWGKPGK